MLGSAAGDALGYPVRDWTACDIFDRFGAKGIREHITKDGRAQISYNTQIGAFVATALASCFLGNSDDYLNSVYSSYQRYFEMISDSVTTGDKLLLARYREFCEPRDFTPNDLKSSFGNGRGSLKKRLNDINDTKCLAPGFVTGILFNESDAAVMGANIAALTHGNDLAIISSAFVSSLISTIIRNPCIKIHQAITSAKDTIMDMLVFSDSLSDFSIPFDKAVELSFGNLPDIQAIKEIGTGQRAEEAIAIAVYCVLKHFRGFGSAIVSAVNHSGNSSVTGFLVGGIMGAYLGKKHIPEKYLKNLEGVDAITSVTEEMFRVL